MKKIKVSWPIAIGLKHSVTVLTNWFAFHISYEKNGTTSVDRSTIYRSLFNRGRLWLNSNFGSIRCHWIEILFRLFTFALIPGIKNLSVNFQAWYLQCIVSIMYRVLHVFLEVTFVGFPLWAKHLTDLLEYGFSPMWAKHIVSVLLYMNKLSR